MRNRLWALCVGLALAVAWTGPPATAAEKAAVFDMEQVSGSELNTPNLEGEARPGQSVPCRFAPHGEVKKYPELKSKRPIYGTVTFDQNPYDPGSGIQFFFAIDESGGDGKGYDRLYFDNNRDLDLTNDPVAGPKEREKEKEAKREKKDGEVSLTFPRGPFESGSRVEFDVLNLDFDHGPGLGIRPLKIRPQLAVSGRVRAFMTFTAAVARKGKIKIGDREYTALLTQAGMITGRFDRPYTGLLLTPAADPRHHIQFYQRHLCAMRVADGTYYKISATPAGDKLTVTPCIDNVGILRVAAGDPQVKRREVAGGMLVSKDAVVPLGNYFYPVPTDNPQERRIPVGDYMPRILVVDFDSVRVSLRPHGPLAFNIKIRKDKPFLLDLSAGKPRVVFTSPTETQTFKPGDQVLLSAVVIDPELNLRVNGLADATRKDGERTYTYAQGKKFTAYAYPSLNPTVVIRDSSGKQVGEGKMPFG